MKGTYSLPVKIVAILLCMIFLLMSTLCGVGIGLSAVYGIYNGQLLEQIQQEITEESLYRIGYSAGHHAYNYGTEYYDGTELYDVIDNSLLSDPANSSLVKYLERQPGVYYDIRLDDDHVLATNYSGQSSVANVLVYISIRQIIQDSAKENSTVPETDSANAPYATEPPASDVETPDTAPTNDDAALDVAETQNTDPAPAPNAEKDPPLYGGESVDTVSTDTASTDTGETDIFLVTEASAPETVQEPVSETDMPALPGAEESDAQTAPLAQEETVSTQEADTTATVTQTYKLQIHLWGTSQAMHGSYLALYHILEFLHRSPILNIILFVTSLLCAVLLFIFLMCAAGRHATDNQVHESPLDKIPLDLFTAGALLIIVAAVFLFMDSVLSLAYDGFTFFALLSLLLYVPAVLVLLGYFMSLATRIKTGRAMKNTLCWMFIAWCGRMIRKLWRRLVSLLHDIPLVPKAAIGVAILFWINLIGCVIFGPSTLLFLFPEMILLAIFLLWYAVSLRRLQDGIQRMADGHIEQTFQTQQLPHACKKAAEDLNHISQGLSKAVDARLKIERFKTELITNVSHDIKTPLTSIINYVDLIKKLDNHDPTLLAYLDVLDRQSKRLKKLTEDLVEASKASSGVLTVELAPCELPVMLDQVEGEYAEKLAACNLTLITHKPDHPLVIMADGRHLGRIFDNLMGNILKYAQPGTRVYLDADDDGSGHGTVTFLNISGAPLHIPAEELMERFVRGDASRHTEGSGLGLAIVRSLTELQGGELSLSIDGDLFKAKISFPLCTQTET